MAQRGVARGAKEEAGPVNVDQFIQMLRDPDRTSDFLSIVEGGRAPANVVPALLGQLSDPDTYVRLMALQALAFLGDSSAVPRISVVLLEDPDPEVRSRAAMAIDYIGDSSAVPALIAALSDADASVRGRAAGALRDFGDPSAASALLQRLSDPDEGMRANAAIALGTCGDQSALPALIRLLSDPQEIVRLEAEMAIGEIGDPEGLSVQALARRVSDESWEVRIVAIKVLAHLEDSRAVPALVGALNDRFYEVQVEAVRALGEVGSDARAVRPLMEMLTRLSGRDEELRAEIINSVAMIYAWREEDFADPGALPLLTRLLVEDPSAYIRHHAADALGRIVFSENLNPEDESINIRSRAASTLRIISPEAVQALIESLSSDPDPSVRAAAATALSECVPVGHEGAISVLMDALSSPSSMVRLAAARSLGWIGTSETARMLGLRFYPEDTASAVQEAISHINQWAQVVPSFK